MSVKVVEDFFFTRGKVCSANLPWGRKTRTQSGFLFLLFIATNLGAACLSVDKNEAPASSHHVNEPLCFIAYAHSRVRSSRTLALLREKPYYRKPAAPARPLINGLSTSLQPFQINIPAPLFSSELAATGSRLGSWRERYEIGVKRVRNEKPAFFRSFCQQIFALVNSTFHTLLRRFHFRFLLSLFLLME